MLTIWETYSLYSILVHLEEVPLKERQSCRDAVCEKVTGAEMDDSHVQEHEVKYDIANDMSQRMK